MRIINIAVIILIVALGLAGAAFFLREGGIRSPAGMPSENRFYTIERVVDGDTIVISGVKVRLIGVDAPEYHTSAKLYRDAARTRRDIKTIQALGSKASRFTERLCAGKRARLEFDVEKRDRYGRVLAYVYLEDGTFVNAEILKEGFGQVMTIPPNVRYAELFREAERKAREDKRGLW